MYGSCFFIFVRILFRCNKNVCFCCFVIYYCCLRGIGFGNCIIYRGGWEFREGIWILCDGRIERKIFVGFSKEDESVENKFV